MWSALQLYGEIAREQRFALVLNEFQYFVEADASVPSQIQAWWDTSGLRSRAFVVIRGSQVEMMEALSGASQPLYGRFTSRCKLQPMAYYDTAHFYDDSGWTTRDKLTAYGVLGGTPKYHAVFSPDVDLGSNIIRHVLSRDGLLHNEPEVVICSSPIREPSLYNSVLQAVAAGETRRSGIEQRAGVTPSQFAFCSQTLMELEWMRKERPFGEDSTRRTIYTITDHFIHFWYRFVSALAGGLEFQDAAKVYTSRLEPGRFGRDRHSGDLEDGRTLACECKWSSSPIGVNVYYELMRKVALLPPPRGTGLVRYMLFSVAGFDDTTVKAAARDGVILVSGEDLLRRHRTQDVLGDTLAVNFGDSRG